MSQNPVTRLYGPRSTKTSDTLLERMGGEKKLDELVTAVYNDMRGDREIGKSFARFRLERLKDRTVDYLRGEFGGEPYKGSDLWISHSHMGISSHWYDIMMKYYTQRLKKARIGKKEQQEILESLEKMRLPIVDPGLKLKDMYLKHSEREAAKVGGDGWGHVSNDPKERAKKEKDTLIMLARSGKEEVKDQVLPAKVASAMDSELAEPTSLTKKALPRVSKSPRPPETNVAPAAGSEPVEPSSLKKKKEVLSRVHEPPKPVPEAAPPQARESEVPESACEGSTAAPVKGSDAEAKRAPKKAARKSKKVGPAEPLIASTLYDFLAELDTAPPPVPRSQPSAAELLYRLSVPCAPSSDTSTVASL